MTQKKQQTVASYNASAKKLAERYGGFGARVEDVEEAFGLVERENPSVLEIGCGNGRDAEEIVKRTKKYRGMDISEGMIDLARQRVPQGTFEVADIEAYAFPFGLDIVFSFASLIHVPKESLRGIFHRMHAALNPGGVARISLKWSDPSSETVKKNEFGTRYYHLYSEKDIEDLASRFSIKKMKKTEFADQTWLEILLQK